ncbi:MAG TPA: hypothetical protein DEF30_04925 [Proteiniclasticum sp.]|nr:hypothetical protein [Proteiniclasticum sp.]
MNVPDKFSHGDMRDKLRWYHGAYVFILSERFWRDGDFLFLAKIKKSQQYRSIEKKKHRSTEAQKHRQYGSMEKNRRLRSTEKKS